MWLEVVAKDAQSLFLKCFEIIGWSSEKTPNQKQMMQQCLQIHRRNSGGPAANNLVDLISVIRPLAVSASVILVLLLIVKISVGHLPVNEVSFAVHAVVITMSRSESFGSRCIK